MQAPLKVIEIRQYGYSVVISEWWLLAFGAVIVGLIGYFLFRRGRRS